ncbi:hypothetical protein RUND412_007486 [Rhizina undulata]
MKSFFGILAAGLALVPGNVAGPVVKKASTAPTLTIEDDWSNGTFSTTIANDVISMHVGRQYGTKLMYKGVDLVGDAVGAYASYNGRYYDLNYTSATIHRQTSDMLDVAYTATEGIVHFVLFTGLAGFYSYFVNTALGEQGEFRTLYRLDPQYFTNGHTYLKDEALPLLSDIVNGTKVQDETWERPDGTYITKYDWSFFVRDSGFHGVYGDEFGAFVINPGKDYINGDSLKQELSVHRESSTGDAVLLNMLHGTHFMASFSNIIPEGKVFGPWLVYINDGNTTEAAEHAKAEYEAWPYEWFEDILYQSRGTVSGTLVLENGTPASGAAVFIGDAGNTLQQGTTFQYTTYADSEGKFEIKGVRTEKSWTLQAWSNGGDIGDVTTVFSYGNFSVANGSTTDLGSLVWNTQGREGIWQIGDFDRKSLGFAYGGDPYTHGLVDNCPANLTYTIGTNTPSDWCFGKSAKGVWEVVFDIDTIPGNQTAILSLSIAGFSGSGTTIGGVGSALEISLNGNEFEDSKTAIGTDPCLYRSGTTGGEWRYYEWEVGAEWLQEGNNTLSLVTDVTATRWRGIMWDMVKFEWA